MSDSFTFTEQRLELTSAHNACKGFEYYCHICPKRALLQIRMTMCRRVSIFSMVSV